MDQSTVSGTIYDVEGNPASGVPVFVQKVVKSGAVIQHRSERVAVSNDSGQVSFTVPRNSTAWISGLFYSGSTNFSTAEGISVAIPDAATATLESLGAAASVPSQGLTVESDGTALPHPIGTLNFSSAFTVTESETGVALIDSAGSIESIQDTVAAMLPTALFAYDDPAGTLPLTAQAANKVFAGPTTGSNAVPTWRSLVAADIPSLLASKISDFTSAVLAVAPAPAWGAITGTLSAQTDLQTALNAKLSGSSLTTNTLPKATSPTTLGDSRITDDGTDIQIINTVGIIDIGNLSQGYLELEGNHMSFEGDATSFMTFSGGPNATLTLDASVKTVNIISSTESIAIDGVAHTITQTAAASIALNAPSILLNGLEAATRNYVDNLVTGLQWKTAVRVATTANGTLATAFANGQTVDGVTLATGDRILLKNQSTGSQNGIYVVAASGAPTRATDSDSGAELISATVFVREGTTNGDTQWTCTNDSITLGSTSVVFAQVSGAGTYAAGSGLTLTGNSFSIANGAITNAMLAGSIDLTAKVTGTLPVANGGTGITSFGTGIATFLGTPSSANLAAAMTDETGSGALVFATSPTLVTPTLGVASATSVNKWAFTAPTTAATLTAGADNCTYTFPATSQTIPGLSQANTWTANGALSSGAGPAAKFNGTWITGGDATTTKPYVLIEPSGATSTAWNTSGTGFGINAASAFTGMLADFQLNGVSKFRVDSTGAATAMTTVTAGNAFIVSSGNFFRVQSLLNLTSTSDGVANLQNSTVNGLRGLILGATNPTLIGAGPTHGQTFSVLQAEELLTIAAAATSTTTMQVPAGAIVLSVSVRNTVAIPTAATYTVKIGAQAFNTVAVPVALNTTDAGTAAGAFYLAAATAIVITPDLTPANNNGRVRITVTYLLVTPATS